MYKISIVIPLYNTEKYLEECLNSLINQTIGFENLQVIIVDDHSTDNSKEIADKYAKKYDNILVLQTEKNSGGAGHPRNVGLKNVGGKYIMFLDPDDFYELDACEYMYKTIEEHKTAFVVAGYRRVTEESDLLDEQNNTQNKKLVLDEQKSSIVPFGNSVWNKIYLTEFIKKNDIKFLESVSIAEDAYFANMAFVKGKEAYYTGKIIYNYRVRGNTANVSLSKNYTKKYFSQMLTAYINIYKIYKENNELENFKGYYLTSLQYWLNDYLLAQNALKEDELEVIKIMYDYFKITKELNIKFSELVDKYEEIDLMNKIANGDFYRVREEGKSIDVEKVFEKDRRLKVRAELIEKNRT